jgi:hypothetical protein
MIIWKDIKGGDLGLTEVICWHLDRQTQKNKNKKTKKNLSQDSQCLTQI